MEKLKLQRQIIKSGLTRIYNACATENIPVEEAKVRGARADELFGKFEAVQQEIEYSATAAQEQEQEETYRIEVEERYIAIKTLCTRMLDEASRNLTIIENQPASNDISTAVQSLIEHQGSMGALLEHISRTTLSDSASTPIPAATSAAHGQHELRLPQIQIPDFDGSCTEWIRFRDLFETVVHNRSTISDIEKLEYLQTKMKGEALSLIKHLKPTNANYSIAWELLKRTYEKSDKVKNAYFALFFNQVSMKAASVAEAKRIYNASNESVNALKVLNEPVQYWDSILLFHLEKKLDAETLALWYREKKEDAATFQQYLDFLERRVFELENTQKGSSTSHSSNHNQNRSSTYTTTLQKCPECSKEHSLYSCDQFRGMEVEARRRLVQAHNLCFNFLQANHRAAACKRSLCRECNAKHNTLLHSPARASKQQAQCETQPAALKDAVSARVNVSQQCSQTVTLLPTAVVMIYDAGHNMHPCRVLLDSGSQGTLIAESCVQRLQLKRQFDKTMLYGVGSSKGNCTRGKVHLRIKSNEGSTTVEVDAMCLANLTQTLPTYEVTHHKLNYFKHLQLADQGYFKPGKIDVILDADAFSDCLLADKLTHPSGSPTALKTIFGWVLLGTIPEPAEPYKITAHTLVELSKQLQSFWEVEELSGPKQHLTPDEKWAEEHYRQTVTRDDSGRYVVRLPLRNDEVKLGDSRTAALHRLAAMERRFNNDTRLHKEYVNFMVEYEKLEHMAPAASSPERVFFLPHHSVLKPTSTTTRLRVVFDASCKSTNGLSLNDNLVVGPTIQRDLFDITINFRKYEIGFSADIEKMYRQILVHRDDRSLQRILCRGSKDQSIKEYDLQTVTYGTSAAPFLAIRTLNQIATDNQDTCPEASAAIKQNFYVDDFMAYATSVCAAEKLKGELCTVLSQAGFHLRKWSSNSTKFVENIDSQDRELSSDTIIDTTQAVKMLGLLWETSSDTFKYCVTFPPLTPTVTKRSRVFDPIGWLSPVTVALKIFMQKLWVRGLDWDEELPTDLYNQWTEYRNDVNRISQLRIPRWLEYTNEQDVELHGFSDASEMAYSAAIYLRVQRNDGKILTNLIAAKTKVAPVKQITLPRLELCAAHLMTKLMIKVRNALGVLDAPTFGWTDSSIVLAWISNHPRRWKTFVANRTAQVIDVIPAEQWQHVPSAQNPADLATRGISPAELIDSQVWWKGPSLLRQPHTLRHVPPPLPDKADLEERKELIAHVAVTSDTDIVERYSEFMRLIRITAYLLRFRQNCTARTAQLDRATGFLSTTELLRSHNVLVKKAQASSYESELRILSQGKQLSTSHKLTPLSAFIDDDGLLRVGGRLENARVNYDQKHPFILNKDHHLTRLIARYYHLRYLHAGNRLLQYLCTVCMRQRSITYSQQMGNIPQHRLNPGWAFLTVGVDFAGPIMVRSWKGRGSRLYKCWIALFICLVTRAIHIELVTELSTAAFIASLRRFVSRRGKPIHIHSDNGTNFVGANQHLRELYQMLSSSTAQDTITKELADQQIQWHFSPPSGPHFGGMWEAGIKSVKHHLRRTLRDAAVTYEELHTVLCQIELYLNTRPLCTKFEGDTDPLTPAHFLLLRAPTILPDENLLNLKENALTRWQYLQRLLRHFWMKWSTEYITQLQQRPKWTQRLRNLQVNDVVVIKDDNLPPTQWSIGRVNEVHPGADGLVRVATVQTARGMLKRPIVKLCPLFLDVESGCSQEGPECS